MGSHPISTAANFLPPSFSTSPWRRLKKGFFCWGRLSFIDHSDTPGIKIGGRKWMDRPVWMGQQGGYVFTLSCHIFRFVLVNNLKTFSVIYRVEQNNSCMFEFLAFLPPTNLGLSMHSPSALMEHVSLSKDFLLDPVQGPKKWFAKCDKHYPSRSGPTSLATAVVNFTKPRTSHFFDLCTLSF